MPDTTTSALTETTGEITPPGKQLPRSDIDPDFKRVLNSHAAHSSYYLSQENKELVEFGERAILGAIDGINPKDTIEGMLATMLIGLYNVTMSSIGRAVSTDSCHFRNTELGNVSKLSRAFAGVLEAQNHYRGKGNSQQTITVQHVHINDGAQAIIGSVASTGRGGAKKSGEPHAP